MNRTTDDAVRDYLAEVERALADLPRHHRDEIVAGLREHIDASLAEAPPGDASSVWDVLDRLGTPAAIAAEARGDANPPRRRHTDEYWALGLLSFGSLVLPYAGWVVGVALVWRSKAWRLGDKVLATLFPPFGFMLPFLLMNWNLGTGSRHCTERVSGSGLIRECADTLAGGVDLAALVFKVVFLISAVAPVVTLWLLLRRLRKSAM